MEKFQLTLKNLKLRKYFLLGLVFVFFNIVAQLFLVFTPTYQHYRLELVVAFGLIVVILIAGRINKIDFLYIKQYLAAIYALLVITWVRWELYWLAALVILVFALYLWSIRRFEVFISEESIIYPSFPNREIQWEELQNAVLKDGILTLDFKNDKLMQNEIEEADKADEKKINEFCSRQLNK